MAVPVIAAKAAAQAAPVVVSALPAMITGAVAGFVVGKATYKAVEQFRDSSEEGNKVDSDQRTISHNRLVGLGVGFGGLLALGITKRNTLPRAGVWGAMAGAALGNHLAQLDGQSLVNIPGLPWPL